MIITGQTNQLATRSLGRKRTPTQFAKASRFDSVEINGRSLNEVKEHDYLEDDAKVRRAHDLAAGLRRRTRRGRPVSVSPETSPAPERGCWTESGGLGLKKVGREVAGADVEFSAADKYTFRFRIFMTRTTTTTKSGIV